MKNFILLFFLFLSIASLFAQNSFPTPTGDAKLAGTNAIEFGQGVTKESNAGKIGYQKFSDALDVVGAGRTGSNRKLKFWGEEGSVFSGNVGIGLASPSYRLDVEGAGVRFKNSEVLSGSYTTFRVV